jgi:crossover junction endodeoxyribonuclease RuvC
MRILGIDPGSHVTGWGVVERRGGGAAHAAHGTLRPTRSAPLAQRLGVLLAGLRELLDRYAPDAVVVEEVFVSASPRAALVLGQARGVALAAAASAGVPVHEYTARTIKAAVTGSGAASKADVQRMVRALLSLPGAPAQDAADALAAALCHARAGVRPPGARSRPSRGRGSARRRGRFVARVVR